VKRRFDRETKNYSRQVGLCEGKFGEGGVGWGGVGGDWCGTFVGYGHCQRSGSVGPV
jgi:hypothetical protein